MNGVWALNCYAFGYAVGFHFMPSAAYAGSSPIHKLYAGSTGAFVSCEADHCRNASVHVEQSQLGGLTFTDSTLVALCIDNDSGQHTCGPTVGGGPAAFPTAVVVGRDNLGKLVFDSCVFSGTPRQVARVAGGGTVAIVDSTVFQWDCSQTGKQPSPLFPPIFWGQCEDDGTFAFEFVGSGSVVVRGNEFQQPGGNHASLGPDLQTAIVTGNTFGSEAKIRNLMQANTSKSCVISMNVEPWHGVSPEGSQFGGALDIDAI
jgi:hypothetical protein